jgi:hypothetical protein
MPYNYSRRRTAMKKVSFSLRRNGMIDFSKGELSRRVEEAENLAANYAAALVHHERTFREAKAAAEKAEAEACALRAALKKMEGEMP